MREERRRQSKGDAMWLPKETDTIGTLPGKPQPWGDTQNSKNGLI